MLLFCPHCDDVVEIFGLPPRPLPECEACGAVLELVADLDSAMAVKTSFETVFGKAAKA